MDQAKTKRLLESAGQVNERHQAGGDAVLQSVTKADFTRPQWAGMFAAFLGIVGFPMVGWIGGLQAIAGALLVWVFYLIQNQALAWQSSTETHLQLIALRDEFAAYREKYGPSLEEQEAMRKARAVAMLTRS